MSDDADIRFADDPQVERWPAQPDRLIVKYPLAGPHGSQVFTRQLRERTQALGIEEITYSSVLLILYGVRKGQEAAVHGAVVETIEEENQRSARARKESERMRPEHEAAAARHEADLDEVREAFRKLRRGEE
jgi:hypothetical protein